MILEFSRPELEHQLIEARDIAGLNAAIASVGSLWRLLSSPEIIGRQMFCPGLDATIPKVNRKLKLQDRPSRKNNDNVCILTSRLNRSGGHSRVAAEIAQMIGAERTTVVCTDVPGYAAHEGLLWTQDNQTLKRRALILLAARTPVGKIFELYNVLAAIRPSRIILLANHMDFVAYAAAWSFRDVAEYLHHADHQPALGTTLPFSAHVDLTYTCHKTCCRAGIPAFYAGMTVTSSELQDGGSRPKAAGRRRVATCGSDVKFRGPSAFRWSDYAIATLSALDTDLLHIGEVSPQFQAEVAGRLAAAGVNPARYVFGGHVPSLPDELVNQGVSNFLSSYPVPGGKTNLEAMAVGLAPLVPIDEDFPAQMRFDFPLPTWTEIARPEEVKEGVARSEKLQARMATVGARDAFERELGRFRAYVMS